jgi:uncharacterized protein (DUF2062 family)
MNPRKWLHEHSLKLLAIRDTPNAIAGGVAIGVFFGFTPLFGIKTLSAIFLAWLTRSNIIAAVLAATAHDVMIPLMPAIYLGEYKVGYWLLSNPHEWPPKLSRMHWHSYAWREWTTFLFGAGLPLLVGSVICGAPFTFATFVLTKTIVARHQRKKLMEAEKAKVEEPDI